MDSSPRTRRAPPTWTACCARSPRACASSRCCCTPWMPERRREAARRARRGPTLALRRRARFGAAPARREHVERARAAASPKPPRDRQPHPPRLAASRPTPSWSPRRDAAGVTQILTVGTDGATCREALAAAEAFPQVYAAIGHHPNEAHGLRRRRPRRARGRSPPTSAASRSARPGLDYFRDYAPRADQERAFLAQIELARATGKPLVIHTRAAEDDTIATLREHAGGVDVILHCFSMPDRLRRVPGRGLVDLVRRQRHLPQERRPGARPPSACPADRLLVETDAPYLTPQAVRKERNQPALVAHTARFVAERARRRATRSSTRGRRAQRRRAVRVVSDASSRRSRACGACGSSACGPSATSARTS